MNCKDITFKPKVISSVIIWGLDDPRNNVDVNCNYLGEEL